MRKQQQGVIINITSIGGLVALPFNAIYHATKFGIDGMSEGLNFELAPFNIRVKTVAPGGVATDFAGRSLVRTIEEGQATPYEDGLRKAFAAFSSRQSAGGYSTPAMIAEVIYTAATDGTGQMRYIAGADAERLYGARQQMKQEDFHNMVKTNFGL